MRAAHITCLAPRVAISGLCTTLVRGQTLWVPANVARSNPALHHAQENGMVSITWGDIDFPVTRVDEAVVKRVEDAIIEGRVKMKTEPHLDGLDKAFTDELDKIITSVWDDDAAPGDASMNPPVEKAKPRRKKTT